MLSLKANTSAITPVSLLDCEQLAQNSDYQKNYDDDDDNDDDDDDDDDDADHNNNNNHHHHQRLIIPSSRLKTRVVLTWRKATAPLASWQNPCEAASKPKAVAHKTTLCEATFQARS